MKPAPKYIDLVSEIATDDVVLLEQKDAEYGGSWAKRGGVGAYMMACRKFDRLEEQVKKCGWDIFEAAILDSREEGVLDDIGDLRRYLLLIEAEIRCRIAAKAPKSLYRASKAKNRPRVPKTKQNSL